MTICGMEAFPAKAGPGLAEPTLMAGVPTLSPPVPTASAMPAPTAPPMRAATTATASHRGDVRTAAGGGGSRAARPWSGHLRRAVPPGVSRSVGARLSLAGAPLRSSRRRGHRPEPGGWRRRRTVGGSGPASARGGHRGPSAGVPGDTVGGGPADGGGGGGVSGRAGGGDQPGGGVPSARRTQPARVPPSVGGGGGDGVPGSVLAGSWGSSTVASPLRSGRSDHFARFDRPVGPKFPQ